MNTKAYKRALQTLVVRLCISVAILAGGWLYPAWRLKHDPDITSDPDFRAGAVLPLAVSVGLVYACMAGWRFYCTREDLHYDARFERRPE